MSEQHFKIEENESFEILVQEQLYKSNTLQCAYTRQLISLFLSRSEESAKLRLRPIRTRSHFPPRCPDLSSHLRLPACMLHNYMSTPPSYVWHFLKHECAHSASLPFIALSLLVQGLECGVEVEKHTRAAYNVPGLRVWVRWVRPSGLSLRPPPRPRSASAAYSPRDTPHTCNLANIQRPVT